MWSRILPRDWLLIQLWETMEKLEPFRSFVFGETSELTGAETVCAARGATKS